MQHVDARAYLELRGAIRISDFGLSCSYEDRSVNRLLTGPFRGAQHVISLQEGQILKRNCGTDSHKAPQAWRFSKRALS